MGTILQVSQHFINLLQFSTEFSDQKKSEKEGGSPLTFEPESRRDRVRDFACKLQARENRTTLSLTCLTTHCEIFQNHLILSSATPFSLSHSLSEKHIVQMASVKKICYKEGSLEKYLMVFNLQIYSSLVTMKLAGKNTLKIAVCIPRRPDFQFCQNSYLEKECDLQIANFWQ